MTEKVFGMIEEVHQTGANSSTKTVKEVSEADLLSDGWDRDQAFKDFVANAKPGEYINFRDCIPIFRVR